MPALIAQPQQARSTPLTNGGASTRLKHISAWLWRLSQLCPLPPRESATHGEKLATIADALAMSELPLEAFSKAAILAVAERHEWFPAFKPLREAMAAQWDDTRRKSVAAHLPDLGNRYRALSAQDRALIDMFRRDELRGWKHEGENVISQRERTRRRKFLVTHIENHHPHAFTVLQATGLVAS